MRNVFAPGFTTKKGVGTRTKLDKKDNEEYQGGSIPLKSEPGVGTIFRITLKRNG